MWDSKTPLMARVIFVGKLTVLTEWVDYVMRRFIRDLGAESIHPKGIFDLKSITAYIF